MKWLINKPRWLLGRLSGLEPVLEKKKPKKTEAAEAEVTAEVRVRRSTGLGNDRAVRENSVAGRRRRLSGAPRVGRPF